MSMFVLDTAGDQALLQNDNQRAPKVAKTRRSLPMELDMNDDIPSTSKKRSKPPPSATLTRAQVEAMERAEEAAEENEDAAEKTPTLTTETLASMASNEDAAEGGYDDDDDDDDASAEQIKYYGLFRHSIDLSQLIPETLSLTERPRTFIEEELERMTKLVDEAAQQADSRSSTEANDDNADADFNERTGKFDEEQTFTTNVEQEMDDTKVSEKDPVEPIKSKRQKRESRKNERSKTKGEGWFNMPATEVTPEVENDLKVLKMRSALDPKRFYKKNDSKELPKYFQVGTVEHSPLDHYSERDTRKNKRHTMVDELMDDEDFQQYNKRKYKEVTAKKEKYAQRKATKKMKKLKKNK